MVLELDTPKQHRNMVNILPFNVFCNDSIRFVLRKHQGQRDILFHTQQQQQEDKE